MGKPGKITYKVFNNNFHREILARRVSGARRLRLFRLPGSVTITGPGRSTGRQRPLPLGDRISWTQAGVILAHNICGAGAGPYIIGFPEYRRHCPAFSELTTNPKANVSPGNITSTSKDGAWRKTGNGERCAERRGNENVTDRSRLFWPRPPER